MSGEYSAPLTVYSFCGSHHDIPRNRKVFEVNIFFHFLWIYALRVLANKHVLNLSKSEKIICNFLFICNQNLIFVMTRNNIIYKKYVLASWSFQSLTPLCTFRTGLDWWGWDRIFHCRGDIEKRGLVPHVEGQYIPRYNGLEDRTW